MTPSCGNVIFFLEDLSEGSNNSIKSCHQHQHQHQHQLTRKMEHEENFAA